MQWGRAVDAATFPIAFSTAVFSLAVTCGNGQDNNYCPSIGTGAVTLTNATFGDRGYWWIAVGK